MSEMQKTVTLCVAAAALAVAAAAVDPGAYNPAVFNDQGELFFPEFTDPNAPKAIEVVDYNEETATATPLKVEFTNGKWVIPSHHGYPADAEDRLAKTAAALIELRKDSIVSNRVEDHAGYGVIDPLDENVASLKGRGKRVTLRDGEGRVLADFILGKRVEDRPGYRYVRVPGQRRVYAAKTGAEASARFQDWIETDLLKLKAQDIRKIAINSYSINEQAGRLENAEKTTLAKSGGNWKISGEGEPDVEKINQLAAALDNLRIVNVQPKPENLTRDLKAKEGISLSRESIASLRGRGFFVTPRGELLSNEGEITVETANGLQYVLRFGEVAGGGTPQAGKAAAGDEEGGEASQNEGERRYLFITVDYSKERAEEYAGEDEPPADGRELGQELRDRFAGWYYVISGADFSKLRPRRGDLIAESPEE